LILRGWRFVVRPKNNRNGLTGRAARQSIEQEDLKRKEKRWARRKNTLAKYAMARS
jgi:hypothetical protein